MDTSSSTDPSSLPNPDICISCTEHAWSQIVCSKDYSGFLSIEKLPQAANSEQIPTIAKEPKTNQVRGQMQLNTELCVTKSEISDNEGARIASARGFNEEAAEASRALEDGYAVAADVSLNKSPENICGDVSDSRVLRPPWRISPVITEGEINPQPVMGATAWPDLKEARNMKTSEPRKSKVSSLQSSHADGASIQESPSPSKASLFSNYQQGVKNKPPSKGDPIGMGRPAFQPIENGASFLGHPVLGAHGAPEQSKGDPVGMGRPAFQPIENGASFLGHPALGAHGAPEQSFTYNMHAQMKGNFSANPSVDNVMGRFHNNNRKWWNNHRDQGRHHGKAYYENAGDIVTLLHEQRIGPRNMPRPQPFMNTNPGFYSVPSYQNGGMHYTQPGVPEFLHRPPYFPPIAPPGGMLGPDPFALRSMLIKQVDYYFSVQNLCRDVFLRTHMDEEGFVSVSIIAQFNRIRSLSSNPVVILKALQHSAVVEVQFDRIRRRNDRGKWRLAQDQAYAVNPVQENVKSLSEGEAGQTHEARPVVSLEEANIVLDAEQKGDGGLAVSSEEANNGLAKASDVPASLSGYPSDRLNGSDGCVNDFVSDNTQHISMLRADASTQSSVSYVSRDVSIEENAVCSLSASNSAECQSSDSTTLQDGSECMHENQVASNQQKNSSQVKVLEERDIAGQAFADGKPACGMAPEGFWMENSASLMHEGFEHDSVQPREIGFTLQMHDDLNMHIAEASDRGFDRLINVSHTSLGSVIAVP